MASPDSLPVPRPDDPRFPSEWFPRLSEARGLNNRPLTLWDVFAWQSTPLLLAGAATLFWPRFVEVRGCVLRHDCYRPDNFQHWWEKLNGDHRRIEGVLNHQHISDLYLNSQEEAVPEFNDTFARILGQTWRAALTDQFPGRGFDVQVSEPGAGFDAEVTFFSR